MFFCDKYKCLMVNSLVVWKEINTEAILTVKETHETQYIEIFTVLYIGHTTLKEW